MLRAVNLTKQEDHDDSVVLGFMPQVRARRACADATSQPTGSKPNAYVRSHSGKIDRVIRHNEAA
jgi:hypothetical protein